MSALHDLSEWLMDQVDYGCLGRNTFTTLNHQNITSCWLQAIVIVCIHVKPTKDLPYTLFVFILDTKTFFYRYLYTRLESCVKYDKVGSTKTSLCLSHILVLE